jgi:hypothetical protein
LSTAFLVSAGLAGTTLLLLWTLTTHYAAWTNANLLVFNPFAFVLIGATWRSRHGTKAGRLARTVMALQLGAALVALLVHLLPGVHQENFPWLLFAIPVWLAIAAGLKALLD